MSLTERVVSLLAETEAQAEGLLRRKSELITEREDEIANVRERYRIQLDEIDRDLGLAQRLRKALDPAGAKRETAAKREAATRRDGKPRQRAVPGMRKVAFKPSDATLADVFGAMATGAETVMEIVPHVSVSRGSVENVIGYARQSGMVRLAGTTKPPGGHGVVRRWRLTPQGEEFLSASRNGDELVPKA